MDITFNELRSKEIVNVFDGKRLGRITDVSFDGVTGRVVGFVVPGLKKVFKKSEDLFIPLRLIKKIGDDVILVNLEPIEGSIKKQNPEYNSQLKTYVRYKRVVDKEK